MNSFDHVLSSLGACDGGDTRGGSAGPRVLDSRASKVAFPMQIQLLIPGLLWPVATLLELAKVTGHRDLRVLSRVYYAPDMQDVASKLD